MSIFSEATRIDESSRQKAKNNGEELYRRAYIDFRKTCVKCDQTLQHDLLYEGPGEQLACDCRKWEYNYETLKYEPVESEKS